MAKSDGTADNTPEKEARWGTWEELLLAGAVNRHGTKSWDSVADELQKRSSVPTMLLSPESCRLKYLDLKRRFSSGEVNGVDDECGERTETAVPLLEELRRLRVAELRREVERYDISIVSLQLKVKTLTEERDRSLREDEKSDPAMSENQEIRCEEKNEGDVEITPELDAGEPVTGDKDQQSMNESNSTDQKDANARTGTKDDGKHLEAILTGNVEDEPDKVKEGKPGREDSCNCSSNSVEKEPVHEVVKLKTEPVTDSTELLESVAESKGNEEGTKENSDVQSSASKSRKTGDADRSNRRSSSRDERANTNESPAVKEMPVEFQPLINFLEKIESNKHYSLFMRRLESQETEDYKLLIRQHIDLEMVRAWLEEGRYLVCKPKFFRDLLLLANNAIIFFGKNTSEFLAAMELRQLVSNELPRAKLYSSSVKQKSIKLASLTKEENSKPAESLLLKTKQSGSLVVCRKRSSITPKSSGSSSGVDKRREQIARRPDDKPVTNSKQQPSQTVTNSGENRITKKRTRDRFSSASTTSRRNEKNSSTTIPTKNAAAVVEKTQGKRERDPSPQNHQSKSENTNDKSSTDLKKRSAANFLNRMKQGSSSNSGSLLDALKSTPLSADSKGGGGYEKKRNESGKSSGRKEPASSKPPEATQQTKEKGSLSKKSSGRPPKRGAAPSPQSSKRNLDVDHSESLASKQPKKRARR
nr:Bromodomain-containing protein [Ipomoea batatas]